MSNISIESNKNIINNSTNKLLVTILNNIDGTQYNALYINKNGNKLDFKDIESKIANDVVKKMDKKKFKNIVGIHCIVDKKNKNYIHVLDENKLYSKINENFK